MKMRAAGDARQGSDGPSGSGSRGLLVIALVLVLLVAGLGAAYSIGLLTGPGVQHSSSHTSSSATSVASTTATTALSTSTGAPTMPQGCVSAGTDTSGGIVLEVFLSNSTKVGGSVCLGIVVQNESNSTLSTEYITQMLNITDSSGRLVVSLSPSLNATTGSLPPGHYIAGSGIWDSNIAYDGISPQPGTYRVEVDVTIPQNGQYAAVELTADADFALTN